MQRSMTGPIIVGPWTVQPGPYGARIDASHALVGTALRRQSVRVLPEDRTLVGRETEVGTVLDAMRSEGFAQVWGPCGIGKSSLLTHVAYRAMGEFGDRPIVYVDAARMPLADLLQHVHGHLYLSRPFRLLDGLSRSQLRQSRALLFLDNLDVSVADATEIRRLLEESLVVATAPVRRELDGWRSIELRGLPEPAALELVSREAGVAGSPAGDQDDLRRLCAILEGAPLRLVQAAALIRSGDRTAAELVQLLHAGDPVEVLSRECRGGLDDDQRLVLAALAMAAGAFLPTDLVGHVSEVVRVVDQLRALQARGIADERRGRFGLPTCSLGEQSHLVGPSLEHGLALHHVVEWLNDPSTSPQSLIELSHSLVTLLEFAAETEHWDAVVEIAHLLEPALTVAGQWETWHLVLNTGLRAAEELGDDLERANFQHQLGTRAICLDDHVGGRALLQQSLSVRRREGPPEARRVTQHNLRCIAVRPAWLGARSMVTAAATIIAAVVGLTVWAFHLSPSPPAPAHLTSATTSPTTSPTTSIPVTLAPTARPVPPTTPRPSHQTVVTTPSPTQSQSSPAVLPAPGALRHTENPTEVVLSWDPVPGATGYVVMRDGLTLGAPSRPQYTDASVKAGTTYTYAVEATNATTTSGPSTVRVTVPAIVSPLPPIALTVTVSGTTVSVADGSTTVTCQSGATCSWRYPSGTSITLSADGSYGAAWSPPCAARGTTCTLVLRGPTQITVEGLIG